MKKKFTKMQREYNKMNLQCFEAPDGSTVHAWECSCKEKYWESAAGKKDKHYPEYLEKKPK